MQRRHEEIYRNTRDARAKMFYWSQPEAFNPDSGLYASQV